MIKMNDISNGTCKLFLSSKSVHLENDWPWSFGIIGHTSGAFDLRPTATSWALVAVCQSKK